jgi:hypothetical protein
MKNLLRNLLIICSLVAGIASTLEARPHRHRGHRAPRVIVRVATPVCYTPVEYYRPVQYFAPVPPVPCVVPVQRVVRVHRQPNMQPRFGFNVGFGFRG